MSNPTIEVKLDSLQPGTVPSVTQEVSVAEGGQLDVTVTWPSDAPNTITVDLQFTGGDQDPFNDEANGDTNFQLTRPSGSETGTETLQIMNDATLTADNYDLTLTINDQSYVVDPVVVVSTKPPM